MSRYPELNPESRMPFPHLELVVRPKRYEGPEYTAAEVFADLYAAVDEYYFLKPFDKNVRQAVLSYLSRCRGIITERVKGLPREASFHETMLELITDYVLNPTGIPGLEINNTPEERAVHADKIMVIFERIFRSNRVLKGAIAQTQSARAAERIQKNWFNVVGIGLIVVGMAAWAVESRFPTESDTLSKDAIEELLRQEDYREELMRYGKNQYFDSVGPVSKDGYNQGINVQTVYEPVIENGMRVTWFDVQVTWTRTDGFDDFTKVIKLKIVEPLPEPADSSENGEK